MTTHHVAGIDRVRAPKKKRKRSSAA